MNRRIVTGGAAILVFAVYVVFYLRGDSRHEELIQRALSTKCTGNVVLVGVDNAKTRVVGDDKFKVTYTTTLVDACGAKWEVEVKTGHGTIPEVTQMNKVP